MNHKLIPAIFLLLTVGSVSAIWAGGISWTGTLTATGGAESATLDCTLQTITITDETMGFMQCDYVNPNSAFQVDLTMDDSGIVSTDGLCTYETNSDVVFMLETDTPGSFLEFATAPVRRTIGPGSTPIVFRYYPDVNRCPLTGTWEVTGTIV